jgi:hypothetical protein
MTLQANGTVRITATIQSLGSNNKGNIKENNKKNNTNKQQGCDYY